MRVEYLSAYEFCIIRGKRPTFSKGFSLKKYSRFKYGERRVITYFAKLVYYLFIKKYKYFLQDLKSNTFVVATPYKSIPTAATYLAEGFFKKLNKYFKRNNKKNLQLLHLRRKTILYPLNYAELNTKERKKVVNSIHLLPIKKNLKRSTVILVDDCYITGAMVKRLLSLFKSHKVENVFVLTVIRCVNRNKYLCTGLESKLNHAWVSSPERFLSILSKPTFLLVTRTLRFFVEHKDLLLKINVLSKISKRKQNAIYKAIIDEGYIKNIF